MILMRPSHKILSQLSATKILKNLERAGRTCYKSESKISVISSIEFTERIIKNGHHSVIEHENISVKFVCDRGVTHEIVRHRLAAYSQESTRYCNYKGGVTFIIPTWIKMKPGEYFLPPAPRDGEEHTSYYWAKSMWNAERDYINLLNHGWTPQQARSVLPNSLKTEIIMTANIREWRHVLKLRTSPAAHPQMRELMIPLLEELQKKIPVLFGDIT